MPAVKQWKLKEEDKLDWEWKVQDGEMVLIVRMVREGKKEGLERYSSIMVIRFKELLAKL